MMGRWQRLRVGLIGCLLGGIALLAFAAVVLLIVVSVPDGMGLLLSVGAASIPALIYAGIVLRLDHYEIEPLRAVAACFAWGLGAGVTMTQGRTIVQMLAAPDMRGRMLALFQLGFLGGTPIGALLMGSITQVVGPSIAMWIGAGCMSVVLALLTSFTGLTKVRLYG